MSVVSSSHQPASFLRGGTPVEKVFCSQVSEDGKVHFDPSPKTARERSRIYALWNEKTGETYIGKTDQEFRKRLSQHAYLANHQESSGSQTPLYASIRKDPTQFRFGVLKQAQCSSEDLPSLERKHISTIEEEKRLNCNQGGGGGTSQENLIASPNKENRPTPELLETPKKYHPVKKLKGRVTFELPEETAISKGNIYVIKQLSTGKRYIGYTGQTLAKRLASHSFQINHPKKDTRDSLYTLMREKPEDFVVGLLARHVLTKDLPSLEKAYIRKKDAVAQGFNQNQGGGGSMASHSLRC
jgi:hypothetical protein